jgi:tRNA(Ile)-lysidine synthase
MDINLPKPGKYVVAVSGGVDSVCLLDLLARKNGYQLVVAHFNHGIRSDSYLDAKLVEKLAGEYGTAFYLGEGKLGGSASEASARRARYQFLNGVKVKTGSLAIITAHHQDDRIETVVINLIRGTGRKGLSSIMETAEIKRPLLNVPKHQLRDYALLHNLSWREDSSNLDRRYLRNYVRLEILPKLNDEQRLKLLKLMDHQVELNQRIDKQFRELYKSDRQELNRSALVNLSYNESKELVASWLRENNLLNFDRRTIERITIGAKTKRPGTRLDVYEKRQVVIGKESLALDTIER